MRTNAKGPAFPLISDKGYVINAGLNKRELFALIIMHGLTIAEGGASFITVIDAVKLADALVDELSKKKTND
jgi:hypothetical protein